MSKAVKSYGIEYLAAALTVIVAASVIGWHVSRSVTITEVSVTGNYMADADEIIRFGGVEKGMHADSIVYLEVIEQVELHPWVASAYVSLSHSGHMRIRVEEEQPMALLVDGGRTALVAESGIILPVILGRLVDVPLLYGFSVAENVNQGELPDTLRSGSFKTARDFFTSLRRYDGLYAMISEVMVTDTDGVVALTDDNAVRLTFGHDQFDKRIRKWQAFQTQVAARKETNQLRSLDLRFRDQIVARN